MHFEFRAAFFQIRARIASLYEDATRDSSATVKFNCHSYAWYSQDTVTNVYWIDDPTPFFSDYSYLQVFEPQVGDIVLYRETQGTSWTTDDSLVHSAIIVELLVEGATEIEDLIVKSKWGRGGVYIHNGYECCYTEYAFEKGYTSYTVGLADQFEYYRAHDHIIVCEPISVSSSDYYSKHMRICDNYHECEYVVYENHNWELEFGSYVMGDVSTQAIPRYVCWECGLVYNSPFPPQ